MNRRISLSLPQSYVEKLEQGRAKLNLSRSAFARLLLDLSSRAIEESHSVKPPSTTPRKIRNSSDPQKPSEAKVVYTKKTNEELIEELRDLYPKLNEEELEEVREFFERYLRLVIELCQYSQEKKGKSS